eukprot:TRINITY_DN15570_c0_g1_i1.p1 TRINITY_DN15570_c0_g1~~TRINITY_DN15570_c0_g1_i1.p1  ORF type:complete len:380 (-),score=44.70 TRINITY_DN15570_c0_g1_i1:70-1209(-)
MPRHRRREVSAGIDCAVSSGVAFVAAAAFNQVVWLSTFASGTTFPRSQRRLDLIDLHHLLESSDFAAPLLRSGVRVARFDQAATPPRLPVDVDGSIHGSGPRIPRRLFQTLHVKEGIPPSISMVLQRWQMWNADYEYELHDAHSVRQFIHDNYDSSFVRIFDSLGQYQQQSDLWRLCVLYLRGGVYVDADYAPLSPLRDFVPSDVDLVVPLCTPVVVDLLQPPVGCHTTAVSMKRLQNGFIAASPQHPVLYLALQKIRTNFYRRQDQHYLTAMGPALLYDSYASLLGDPLEEIVLGQGPKNAVIAADLAPMVGRGHRPDTILLLDGDGMVVSSDMFQGKAFATPRLLHKYPGWKDAIAVIRDDNSTLVSHQGTCLLRFR